MACYIKYIQSLSLQKIVVIEFVRSKYTSRSIGSNACCKSGYNARDIVTDKRTGVTYDFLERGGNIYHYVLLPSHVEKNTESVINNLERQHNILRLCKPLKGREYMTAVAKNEQIIAT